MLEISDNQNIYSAIEKALESKSKFFAYRLPDTKIIEFGVEGLVQKSEEYFLIHPFIVSSSVPEIRIRRDYNAVEYLVSKEATEECGDSDIDDMIAVSKEQYLHQVNHIVDAIRRGVYKKVVLSYPIYERIEMRAGTIIKSLKKLVEENPHAFVFIYNSRESGMWMGASPENFLSFEHHNITTMALAGTRKCADDVLAEWGDKEKEEQDIVSQYIRNVLENYELDIRSEGPYTLRAGYVEHICTRFRAFVDDSKIKGVLNDLHPTPALAGVPAKEAVALIDKIEYHKRKYYGGYLGPVSSNGDFKFYVNLRSMNFDKLHQCLFVGGGITADSIPEDEWAELLEKSKTLKKILEV